MRGHLNGAPNGKKDAHAKLGEYCQPHAAAAGRQCSTTAHCAVHADLQRLERAALGASCSQQVCCLELVQASCCVQCAESLSHQQQALQLHSSFPSWWPLYFALPSPRSVWWHLSQADECGEEGSATRRCVPGRNRAAASRAAHERASHTTSVHRTAGEGGRALRGQPARRDARRPEEGAGRTGIASTTSNTPANVQHHAATALRVCMQRTGRSGLAWYSACCKARPNKAACFEHVGQSCCKVAYA